MSSLETDVIFNPSRTAFSVDGSRHQRASQSAIVLSPTVVRKINREIVVLLGWGRAVLLQLAHPLVAAGVSDYSTFKPDGRGYAARAKRTIGAMLTLTFGAEEEARAIAAQINAIHCRVSGTLRDASGVFPAGTRYSARDPDLLRWVHATLVDSVPLAYERFVEPLTPEEKNSYCAEATTIGPLLGIPDGVLPRTIVEHERYMSEMLRSGQIEVTENARRLAESLLFPQLGPASSLFSVVRLTTIGLLPASIRQGYGFSWAPKDERALESFTRLVRHTRRWLPPRLREWPAARAVT
jgi:uncharacterized protein (DUF2236 family)